MEEKQDALTKQFQELDVGKEDSTKTEATTTKDTSVEDSIRIPRRRTGLVYDVDMIKHFNQWDREHPECPQRITRIYNKHKNYGLLDRCKMIPSRKATEEELSSVHGEKYLEFMKETEQMKSRDLHRHGEDNDSVYFNQHTYMCALLAAGCCLNVTESVVKGEIQNGVAIVRPPGHHAEPNCCMGFCFFSNVAVVAKIAQSKWGVGKILIVDWDIHHGNGTQRIFESDPSVLYFSLHRYDNGTFYPGTTYGNYDVVGMGKGEGYTVNVPWNKRHMGDTDYLCAFHSVLLPIAYEFCPELVIVSAGFDSARGDPKGMCDVTPEGFSHLTQLLLTLAGGKVVMILEGGYNLTSIAESMAACTSTMLGDACPMLEPDLVPCESAMSSIANTRNTHSKYWKSLRYCLVLPESKDENEEKEVEEDRTSGYTSDENYTPPKPASSVQEESVEHP